MKSLLSSSEEPLKAVPPSRRGRPPKQPAIVLSATQKQQLAMPKQQPPVKHIIMLPTINVTNVASQPSGTVKPPVVADRKRPTALGKSSLLLAKSPTVPPVVADRKPPTALGQSSLLLAKSPTAVATKSPTTGRVSAASRLVVINTSSAASAVKTQPTTTTSSNTAVKPATVQAMLEKVRLSAASKTTATSNSTTSCSKATKSNTTFVIIRSSASSSSSSSTVVTKSTPATATLVKKAPGSMLMPVKKVLPVKYATIVRKDASVVPAQRNVAPIIKLAPFKLSSSSHVGSNAAVLPGKTSPMMLQDSWKASTTTSTRY